MLLVGIMFYTYFYPSQLIKVYLNISKYKIFLKLFVVQYYMYNVTLQSINLYLKSIFGNGVIIPFNNNLIPFFIIVKFVC